MINIFCMSKLRTFYIICHYIFPWIVFDSTSTLFDDSRKKLHVGLDIISNSFTILKILLLLIKKF